MARIRTVKPEFFRHEDLQALNEKHRDIMLFFCGLWCQCDKAGRFRWRPNHIKLDVLPFTKYNAGTYLDVLQEAGFISKYSVDGEDYGLVCNFKKHQLIWGSETKSPLRLPEPTEDVLCDFRGRTEDIGVRSQESGDIDSGDSSLKAMFEEARSKFPGTRKGLSPEWANFLKKHGKRKNEIVPLLIPAVEKFCKHHSHLKTEKRYIPHFQTWINGEGWTEEYPEWDTRQQEATRNATMTEEERQKEFKRKHVI